MKRPASLSLAALFGAAVSLGSPTASAAIVFDDFTTNGGGFLDGNQSGSDTVDGLTVTVSTLTGTVFESTGGGTGISGGAGNFNVDPDEDFTLVFDQGGVLDSYTVLALNPGPSDLDSSVTFLNTATSQSVTLTVEHTSGGTALRVLSNIGLSFSANDVIEVQYDEVNASDNPEVRFQSFTVVPEPATALLAGIGGLLILSRQRKG